MSVGQFELLLEELGPHLRHRNYLCEPSDPEQCLAVYLRYDRIILLFPHRRMVSMQARYEL